MIETDHVRIIVELVDQVSDDLKKIEARMEKLGAKVIDPEFEVDEDGELSRLEARMKMMERRMTADWHIDVAEGDVAKVAALRNMAGRNIQAAFGGGRGPGGNIAPGVPAMPNIGAFDGLPRRRTNLQDSIDGINDKFRNLGRTLDRIRPSIMDWWQVVAVLIPVMITLGAALVGVIAALSGMAVAAGALIGIGIIGWGDSAAESMQELRMEMGRLKEELFAATRPAATEFAPIARGFIRGIPEQVARLNDELVRLTAFEQGLSAAGGGLIGWAEEALTVIADMQQQIVQVALRMGQALGSTLIDLLSFGLQELYKNQDAYTQLAKAFIDIIAILFNLSKAITFALSQFEPFLNIIVALTGWMGNRFVTATLTLGIALSGLALVLGNVMAYMLGLKSMGMFSFFVNLAASVKGLTIQLWNMFTALNATQKAIAALMATTGVGLAFALVGTALSTTSGPGPGTAGVGAAGGGSTTVNDITIQGNVGDREMNRLLDHLETQG